MGTGDSGGVAQGRGGSFGATLALVVAIALIGGLGIASGRAAPALPTTFELTHRRILSVIGTYSADVSLAKRVRHTDHYGKPYFTYTELGTATVAMDVTDQRGSKFKIGSLKVGPVGSYTPDPYSGGYGPDPPPPALAADEDELKQGKTVTGRLKYRKKRVGHGQYAHTDEFVDWRSSAKLQKKTRVSLAGVTQLGYVKEGATYGEFNFDSGKTKMKSGVTSKLANPNTSALIRGFRLQRGNGVLHGDITWNDDKSGTVLFTKPSNLAGKQGTIRRVAKEYQVTGPKGYPAKLVIHEDGSGTVNLGLGRFAVKSADYGGFQLTFE